MLIKLLTKVFGSRNDRTLRRMRKVVNIINAMEPEMEKLSDEELKGKTAEFRARLEKGEVLENLIPEAFAVVREPSGATVRFIHELRMPVPLMHKRTPKRVCSVV